MDASTITRMFHPSGTIDPREGWMSAGDVISRARGAASLAMRGDGYDLEDRADCAAAVVAQVYVDAAGTAAPLGHGPAREVLRYMDRVERHRAGLESAASGVPSAVATFTRMYGIARNLRRSLDRTRDRDRADAADRARSGGFIAHAPADAAPTVGTPDAAATAAREMLDAIGATPLRKGDGPLFTLAYCAARTADGFDPADAAADIDLSPATARQHFTRAVKRLPSAATRTPADHGEALGLTPPPSIDHGVKLEWPDVRTVEPAPVTVRTDPALVGTGTGLSDWGRDLQAGTPGQRATAARLAHAARIRDGHADR